jgi:peroxiredoxin
MKKLIYMMILLAAAACSHRQGYRISGELAGIEDGTIMLEQGIGGEIVVLDSAVVKDGAFTLEGVVEIPDLYFLRIDEKRGRLFLFLENSDITITGHGDSLYLAKVTGSAVQDELVKFNEGIDGIYERMQNLFDQFAETGESASRAVTDSLEKQLKALDQEMKDMQKAYVKEHPSSYIVPYVIQNLSDELEGEEIEQLLMVMDTALAGSQLSKDLRKRVEVLKRVAIGQYAPDFTMNDTGGVAVTLSGLRGKYLLIDFWAAWCGPCRYENPNVVSAYNKYKDKGFDILGVSLDDDREQWLKAIRDDQLDWHQVSDLKGWANEAAMLYGVNSIPGNLLLDREGRIIARNLRGEDLHNKLAELLD